MIIDRPTLATRNGLGNAIRGWPRWMLCQAFKKHKLCSFWRVKKAYSVGIDESAFACCTCFSLVIILHITYPYPLVSRLFRAALLPSSLLGVSLAAVFGSGFWETSMLFACNATPVPWRTGQKLRLLSFWHWTSFIFFCAPYPHKILAWSFVVPRSNFHPPRPFNLIDL